MTTTPTLMNSESAQYLKTAYNNTIYYICDNTTFGNPLYNQPDTQNENTVQDKQSCDNIGGTWNGTECILNTQQ
jgi:hypothetical protein